jgi:anaerobic magnesium-protoporphyrin IX monomethyl ester cyclase
LTLLASDAAAGSARACLIYPPLMDPTAPYHSLSYLAAAAAAVGHTGVEILDANLKGFLFSIEEPRASQLIALRNEALDSESSKVTPLVRDVAQKAAVVNPTDIRAAVQILRDQHRFYEYSDYRWAVERITAWMHLLSLAGLPGMFEQGFRLSLDEFWSSSKTADLLDRDKLATIGGAYVDYYQEELLPFLVERAPAVIGINVTYSAQLPFTLHLLPLLRAAHPGAHITVGGTDVADLWKYVTSRRRLCLAFSSADTLVIGEGESAFVQILDSVAQGCPLTHPNIKVVADATKHYAHSRPEKTEPAGVLYESVEKLATPSYASLDLHRYLSPEPYVYYSPTRGCYWNKCTFCDYGLNTAGPTSPWRQDPLDKMVRDVESISHDSHFLYFSVDVLAPARILQFAEKIIDKGIKICWGAEIRLEKYWSLEKCQVLRRSGCVAVSVGYESGNKRILDLIDKGTDPDLVAETIHNMWRAGIAVQVMGFTGFPSETYEEAMETVERLRAMRHKWTLGGLGEFLLTPGSFVAKDPGRFGIDNLHSRPGCDIDRGLEFRDLAGTVSADQQADIDREKTSLHLTQIDRPWLGGVDTPHSYFYHARFGTDLGLLLTHRLTQLLHTYTGPWVINGLVVDVPGGQGFLRADGEMLEATSELMLIVDSFSEAAPMDKHMRIGHCDCRMHVLVRSAVRNRILRPTETVPAFDRSLARTRNRRAGRRLSAVAS